MYLKGLAAATAGVAALVLTAVGASAQAVKSDGSFEIAQRGCGWYAISVCSRTGQGARDGVNQYGGYVLDTNDVDNFRPGFFCAVVGPTSRERAQDRVFDMQDAGAQTAYIKRGCPLGG